MIYIVQGAVAVVVDEGTAESWRCFQYRRIRESMIESEKVLSHKLDKIKILNIQMKYYLFNLIVKAFLQMVILASRLLSTPQAISAPGFPKVTAVGPKLALHLRMNRPKPQ
jgi:hypothetical protein